MPRMVVSIVWLGLATGINSTGDGTYGPELLQVAELNIVLGDFLEDFEIALSLVEGVQGAGAVIEPLVLEAVAKEAQR